MKVILLTLISIAFILLFLCSIWILLLIFIRRKLKNNRLYRKWNQIGHSKRRGTIIDADFYEDDREFYEVDNDFDDNGDNEGYNDDD